MKQLISKKITQDARQRLAVGMAILAWLGAATITSLQLAGVIAHVAYISAVALLVGIAVATDNRLSRATLAQTIGNVFEAGLRAATSLQAGIATTACVIETDLTGVIRGAERSEAIGWPTGTLDEQPVDAVIPDRSLRAWQADFRKLQQSGDARATSSATGVHIRGQDGSERVCRMSLARLGDTYVATFVPVKKNQQEEVTTV